MVTVEKRWPNSTIAILATGPSLTAEDVEFCRGKVPVIAINDAHRLAPWADLLHSSDRTWWNHYKGVPSFHGPKYGLGSHPGKANPFHKLPDVQVLRYTGDDGLELDPSGLRSGGNSGYAAINLAVHLGATTIVLLGYNLSWPGGKAHFFGNHPAALNQQEGLVRIFIRAFATLVEPLKALGVRVINATKDSALKCFPKATLAEALSCR